MKNKFFLILPLLVFSSLLIFAQSDSLSPFRLAGQSGVKSKGSAVGSNSINISLGHLIRGGTVVTYERLIGEKGISLYAGIGFSARDILGQYSLDHSGPILIDQMARINKIGIGRMLDFGVKYYFEKLLGNTFVGFGITSIKNNLKAAYGFEYLQNGIVTNNTYNLTYTNNEIKLVLGLASDPENKFYNEFSFGPKVRFLNYDYLDSKYNTNSNSNYNYIVTKGIKQEVKFRLFLGWKMGVRF